MAVGNRGRRLQTASIVSAGLALLLCCEMLRALDLAALDLPLPVVTHEMGQHRGRPAQGEGRRGRRLGVKSAELTPLYPGYGTHFSYVYVGTPPQRVSVIVDTGSHYTAFPCSGCSQCGQHTDQYWDLKNSSTATVPKCQNQPCVISQSYSEGSSWRAIKVVDRFFVGGLEGNTVPDASSYSIDFLFGCQTSETGLFRTQLADGIMGMGISDDTLPSQLLKQGVARSKIFAMCLRIGGGIMTLGGVDQRVHAKPGISYAKLSKSSGWYNVVLLDIFLVSRDTKERKSLEQEKSTYEAGKGTIVDSGTTDTYLPQAAANKFAAIFKELSGVAFTQANTPLLEAQLQKMPDLVFVLEGADGTPFEIFMPWTNYVDSVGGGKYAFRIYLTEGAGAVLGANFMSGYNVIFDAEGQRVGFAKSDCKYEDYSILQSSPPSARPTAGLDKNGSHSSPSTDASLDCTSTLVPVSECSARCNDFAQASYIASGTQTLADACAKSAASAPPTPTTRECHQPCNANKIVRGNYQCPEKPWTECSKSCIQSRNMPSREDLAEGKCRYQQQTRTCYIGSCGIDDGDYLIFVDLRIMIQSAEWSYAHSEAFYAAMSSLFSVRESSIDLLNDAGNEYTMGVKLHFEMRLRLKDFDDTIAFRKFAQNIPEVVWGPSFPADLIATLEVASKKMDGLDFSRYGYLLPRDVQVLNAVGLPMGAVRDPVDIPDGRTDGIVFIGGDASNATKYAVALLALGALIAVLCAIYLYARLRRESEKDRGFERSLIKLYSRFQRWKRAGNNQTQGSARYEALQMVDLGDDGPSNAVKMPTDDLDSLKA